MLMTRALQRCRQSWRWSNLTRMDLRWLTLSSSLHKTRHKKRFSDRFKAQAQDQFMPGKVTEVTASSYITKRLAKQGAEVDWDKLKVECSAILTSTYNI